MKDFADRMKEIKEVLDAEGQPQAPGGGGGNEQQPPQAAAAATLKEKEDLMDELMEIVENIDHAKGERLCG